MPRWEPARAQKVPARPARHGPPRPPYTPRVPPPALLASPRLRWRAGLVAVAAAALAAYARALPNEFVWDDLDQVQHNRFLGEPGALAAAFTTSYWGASATPTAGPGHYRPLTTASFVLSYAASGADPAAFRAVNLLLHAAAAVLVAVLAASLGLAPPWALLAALVFALHPVNTEAVAWVVERAELAATALALLAVVLWLRGIRGGRRGLVLAGGAVLLVALGFKESAASAVALAAAIAVAEPHDGGLPRRLLRAALRTAPLLVPVGAYLLARRVALGPARFDDQTFFAGVPGWAVALTMGRVVLRYLRLLLVPVGLRAHYDLADFPPAAPADAAALGALALEVALAAAVVWGLLRRNRVALGGAWIGAGLLPFLHLVPFPWLMAERFLYLASGGFALAVASAGEALARRFPAPTARTLPLVGAALALAYVPGTEARLAVWHDEVSFFGRMVEQEPDLMGARVNLASALARRGRVAEAMVQLQRAQELGWRPEMTEPGLAQPTGR